MSDPLPPFALLPSYLRPSALSLLTWTTAQTPHWSPFHLLKPILLTSRENFLMCTSNCIAILLMISSGHVTILFIIYLMKAQLFSITFIIWPCQPLELHLPMIHASHSSPKLHHFLWTGQPCSCFCAFLCMWNSLFLECLLHIFSMTNFHSSFKAPEQVLSSLW